jgi:hypothetical protein
MRLQVSYDEDRNVCTVRNGGVQVDCADDAAGYALVEVTIPNGIQGRVQINGTDKHNSLPPPPVVSEAAEKEAANQATYDAAMADAQAAAAECTTIESAVEAAVDATLGRVTPGVGPKK